MKKYRVESKGPISHFKIDCGEEDLKFWQLICNYYANKNDERCFYREFPLASSEKIYFKKKNEKLTDKDIKILLKKFELIL